MTVTAKRCVLAIALAAGFCAWLGLREAFAQATPQSPVATATTAAPAPQPGAAPAKPQTQTTTEAPSPTIRIVFTTMPPANATVTWGGTRLGRITPQKPLVITRPRDSGPLDVVVRAPGFLPVQTRAHTFEDTRLLVKLTSPEQKSTLLGYRQPIDAGTPLTTDGGVPLAPTEVPPSLSEAPLSPYGSTSPLAEPTPQPTPLSPAVGP